MTRHARLPDDPPSLNRCHRAPRLRALSKAPTATRRFAVASLTPRFVWCTRSRCFLRARGGRLPPNEFSNLSVGGWYRSILPPSSVFPLRGWDVARRNYASRKVSQAGAGNVPLVKFHLVTRIISGVDLRCFLLSTAVGCDY